MRPGPIMSAVAGRTDHINTSVPSSSYILPADHLSALGQGNTTHGFSVVNRMFSAGGPYSMGRTMSMGRGIRMPKAPTMPRFGYSLGGADEGGARGADGIGAPTPVAVAGGEYLLGPSQVMAVGLSVAKSHGLKNVPAHRLIRLGHRALDQWVVDTRRKHVATLKKLPPPATR